MDITLNWRLPSLPLGGVGGGLSGELVGGWSIDNTPFQAQKTERFYA